MVCGFTMFGFIWMEFLFIVVLSYMMMSSSAERYGAI